MDLTTTAVPDGESNSRRLDSCSIAFCVTSFIRFSTWSRPPGSGARSASILPIVAILPSSTMEQRCRQSQRYDLHSSAPNFFVRPYEMKLFSTCGIRRQADTGAQDLPSEEPRDRSWLREKSAG